MDDFQEPWVSESVKFVISVFCLFELQEIIVYGNPIETVIHRK